MTSYIPYRHHEPEDRANQCIPSYECHLCGLVLSQNMTWCKYYTPVERGNPNRCKWLDGRECNCTDAQGNAYYNALRGVRDQKHSLPSHGHNSKLKSAYRQK